MPGDHTYDYAVIRVVPRVDRGERVNVGVIVSCEALDYLGCRTEVDDRLLLALDPAIDLSAVHAQLDAIGRVCRGGPDAGAIGQLPSRGRFRWLVSPRSTIVQPSRVHTGRTADPGATLDHLVARVVTR